MSFADQETAATDAGFQVQVRHALTTSAIAVAVEPSSTVNHTIRRQFSLRVLTSGIQPDVLLAMARAVVNDGVTLTGCTDEQVTDRVEFLWNVLAGV